ncbi:MAG TPA: hypothetical protein VJ812_15025 [Gemmatimonadaceae bacterium]|jgi:hypothetical protein|nr:hypothetical protein [Gemmatimonadaceae bacterium]
MITAGAEGVSETDTPSLPAEVSAMVDDARAAERGGDRRRARERDEAAIRRLPHSRHQAGASVHLPWIGRRYIEAAVPAMNGMATARHRQGSWNIGERRRDPSLLAETPRERGVLHWLLGHEPEVSPESSRAYRLFSQLPVDSAQVKRLQSA